MRAPRLTPDREEHAASEGKKGREQGSGVMHVGETGSRRNRAPADTMDARLRRSSPTAAAVAAVPMLLLFVVSFWSQAAAAYGDAPPGKTALQQHVAFFDRDKDGIISFSETEEGLRAVGVGAAMAKASAALINGALGPKTRPENATASYLSIYIENIHKGKHGSDTGSYDAEGRFVPAKFDEIFTKYAKTAPNALTENELEEMRHANRQDNDYKGWVASKSEWELLHTLAKDKDGFLRKDTVRSVYDGSLFYKLAKNGSSGNQA